MVRGREGVHTVGSASIGPLHLFSVYSLLLAAHLGSMLLQTVCSALLLPLLHAARLSL